MNIMTKEKMEYLLKLSKLELKHDEMENLRKEMSAIISFMNILQEEPLETEEWPDETMACSSSALRSDTVSDSLSKDKVLESASRKNTVGYLIPGMQKNDGDKR